MSDIAIRVENLSKRYRLGVKEEKQDTLVGSVLAMLKRPGQNLQRLRRLTRFADNGADEKDAMWALKDVSFEVKQGEVVGVIGRNGAGKSTLLKILSRITYPTAGRVELHGRVSSLLEVGTGFHPELTGRENIYLNGTILGMRKAEIDRKFDEIVDFSGIEKFIDTPVKRYSSGMGVRLAFSVAAHLEPEILLVDEVLAVGDKVFQDKCLTKMGEVSRSGRTVLVVSHNMNHVRAVSRTGVWLHKGTLQALGSIANVTAAYERDALQIDHTNKSRSEGFVRWRLIDHDTQDGHVLTGDQDVSLEVIFQTQQVVYNGVLALILYSKDGQRVAGWQVSSLPFNKGSHRLWFHFPHLPVQSGAYTWYLSLWDGGRCVDVQSLIPEFIVSTIDRSNLPPGWTGILNLPMEMKVVSLDGQKGVTFA